MNTSPLAASSDLALLASYQLDTQTSLSQALSRLIQTHCQEKPQDDTLYDAYFQALTRGETIDIWPQLSPHGLSQATLMLLSWREQLLPHLPAEAEALINRLSLTELKKAHQQLQTRTPLQADSPAQGLENAKLHTQAERNIGLLFIETGHYESLRISAIQLQNEMLRPQDKLYPIEGGVLMILPNMLGEGHAFLAANRAQSLLNQAFTESAVSPRIGIALWPLHGTSLRQLIHCAKAAAKQCSNEEPAVYQAERDIQGLLLAKLEKPLREALASNRFYLVFQPQVQPLSSGVLYKGAEALLRWQDDKLGYVRPDEAVLVAEQLGLMPQLTRWVIHAALREFSLLSQAGLKGSLSINLTPSNLLDSRLAQEVENALSLWNIPGNRIIFEITESAAIEDLEATISSLYALKKLGCKLALDDFGTGYASLSYLKRLPIDELKIDQSFIRTITQSDTDAHIVESVINLAHKLNLSVVAEGVEDLATLEKMISYDCNLIQGYYFSCPLAPNDLLQYYLDLQPKQ
ncbi:MULTISPECIES: bifunctional diguanylate cyclase/phosphodiesterase [unclassified Iodobacter]|uniref:putative bifunctional diguanylate cyclase/phosphodiesterase n=1 Tax=unclassified Iodobacter TaxID=235634 RepID=UPI0025CE873B|nr:MULTISPECIES: GGDEF domain-containing phosphodiesterase [unclassified Iodobacter]MDW5415985.1 GGDEF domain-containing phosphodiesterase [Iodobacter sp. CM08]